MSQDYGDALEMDLATEQIKILTDFPNPGFLRVQYLFNSGLLLTGAHEYQNLTGTRQTSQEMWVLKPGETEQVALDQKIFEGIAVSRKRNRIAWTSYFLQYADDYKYAESAI